MYILFLRGECTESYLFYSQLTLFILSSVAFILAFLFHFKFKVFDRKYSSDLSPKVFDKSFVVFNPYSERRKIFHEFLLFLPFIIFFVCLALAIAMVFLLEASLILSVFVIIIGLNFIVVDDAFEVYENSKRFIQAFQDDEVEFGVGDLKALKLIKMVMPKMRDYYLILSFSLAACATFFQYIFSSLLWIFVRYVDLILKAGVVFGPVGWQVSVFLFAIPTVLFQFFLSKIKGRVFGYSSEVVRLRVSETEELLHP